MMGASGTEAPLAFFSDDDSIPLEYTGTGNELNKADSEPSLSSF
jgi:hypothetical protein